MRYRTFVSIAAVLMAAGASFAAEDDAESRVSSVEVGPPGPVRPPAESVVVGGGSVSRFLFAAGSNFRPRSSDTTFSYSGGGCMSRDSSAGDSWFTYDVDLPQGSVIDFLRLYYYDTDGTYDVDSNLWAFDGAGASQLLAQAAGSGSPGFSNVGSGFFAHPVDTLNQSYSIVVSIQGGVGSTVRLCGVRLRYQFVDPIFADGFETGDTSAWVGQSP
jgi:hypothetical protein